ncbi:hypothetical protein [Oceanobacillus chungangensis]|uniref:hypothetical protein n=1 Tax=Oceanobacillus chungangensis TaxID=1229152 RepID=UPI001472969C|nr:hypothetical protein [Oceanobacillus chungangensis]
MAKRTKKNDADQKNKQGFDSSKRDSEFSKEIGSGSAKANLEHKNRAKKERASKLKTKK